MKLNNMEFKVTEITMHLMLGLMHVVNGDRLVEPPDRFTYGTGRYITC